MLIVLILKDKVFLPLLCPSLLPAQTSSIAAHHLPLHYWMSHGVWDDLLADEWLWMLVIGALDVVLTKWVPDCWLVWDRYRWHRCCCSIKVFLLTDGNVYSTGLLARRITNTSTMVLIVIVCRSSHSNRLLWILFRLVVDRVHLRLVWGWWGGLVRLHVVWDADRLVGTLLRVAN